MLRVVTLASQRKICNRTLLPLLLATWRRCRATGTALRCRLKTMSMTGLAHGAYMQLTRIGGICCRINGKHSKVQSYRLHSPCALTA